MSLKIGIILTAALTIAPRAFAATVDISGCYGSLPPAVQALHVINAVDLSSCGPLEIGVHGEQHDSQADHELYTLMQISALHSNLYTLIEGQRFETGAEHFNNGLDSGNISEVTSFKVYSSVIRMAVMAKDYGSALQFLGKSLNVVRSLSKEWSQLKRPLADAAAEKYAVQIDSLLLQGTTPIESMLVKGSPLMDLNGFFGVVQAFTPVLEQSLYTDPTFKTLSQADLATYGIQNLREIQWLKNINQLACAAARQNKEMWIEVGDNHSQNMACGLKKMFPQARITLTTTGDIPRIAASFFQSVTKHQTDLLQLIKNHAAALNVNTANLALQFAPPSNSTAGLPPVVVNISGMTRDQVDTARWTSEVLQPLQAYVRTLGWEMKMQEASFLVTILPLYPVQPLSILNGN